MACQYLHCSAKHLRPKSVYFCNISTEALSSGSAVRLSPSGISSFSDSRRIFAIGDLALAIVLLQVPLLTSAHVPLGHRQPAGGGGSHCIVFGGSTIRCGLHPTSVKP